MKLTFAIMDPPFESARSTTFFRLLAIAAERGYEVGVFAYEGAVHLAFERQSPRELFHALGLAAVACPFRQLVPCPLVAGGETQGALDGRERCLCITLAPQKVGIVSGQLRLLRRMLHCPFVNAASLVQPSLAFQSSCERYGRFRPSRVDLECTFCGCAFGIRFAAPLIDQ